MTGVRTEWHLAELSSAEADPFATVVYSTGLVLDLTAPDESLVEEWTKLLYREGRMARTGLTCQLKDDGQDCRTCAAATLDPEEARSRLCRLGKDEKLLEATVTDRASARQAPLRELAMMMEEAMELAEIPDDLSELLTSVGL